MPLPKPQVVANWLIEIGNNVTYKKLSEITYDILRSKLIKTSAEEISDYVEQFIGDIARELFRKENDAIEEGIETNFDIEENDGDFYILFTDKPEIELLRTLQKDTADNFEFFCKNILDKLGGRTVVLGGSNDGGVDFESYDLLINNLPMLSTKGSRIFLLGQAKRYTDGNMVKIRELKEFIGSTIKRSHDLKTSKSNQIGIMQPQITAFWTTSDFHEQAKEYAKDLGIWYLNGVALCQLAIKLGLYPIPKVNA